MIRLASHFEKPVPGFPEQVRNIDFRQGIICKDRELHTRRLSFQRLSRFQRGQRAFQAHQIECGFAHAVAPCGKLDLPVAETHGIC